LDFGFKINTALTDSAEPRRKVGIMTETSWPARHQRESKAYQKTGPQESTKLL